MNMIGLAVVLFAFCITIFSIIFGIYERRWGTWAIKVGKARYNQTTGILEFDKE